MKSTEITFSLDSDKIFCGTSIAHDKYGLEPELTTIDGKNLIDWTGSLLNPTASSKGNEMSGIRSQACLILHGELFVPNAYQEICQLVVLTLLTISAPFFPMQ